MTGRGICCWFRFSYILVIFLVYEGARQFSGSEFLGLRQLRNRMTSQALTSTGELNTRGILGVIRHPWYTAALIVIWIRPLSTAVLCVNTVFTLYLVFGAWLEEQKLIGAYGNEYREYRRRVSMFIPLKWLRSVLKK